MLRRFRLALRAMAVAVITSLAVLALILHLSLSASATSGGTDTPSIAAAVTKPAPVVPLLAPPDNDYAEQSGVTVASPDARPVAQIRERPSGLSQSESVNLPTVEPVPAGMYALQVLASVQYAGPEGSILVTTARPSETAKQLGFSLGEQRVELPSGTAAWTSDGLGGEYPNRVVWQQNDLIITIAGKLSVNQLQALAPLITIGQ